MSNYINVLRRLERERRAPDAIPTPAAPGELAAREVVAPTAPPPRIEPRIAPPRPAAAPAPVAPVAPPVERTVIPLPSVPSTPAAPPPVETTIAAARTPAAGAPAPRAPHAPDNATELLRARAFATEAHPGIATLLDAIRLISNGRQMRVVVFCGASNAEAVTTLADALVTHASRSGMPAFLATLTRTANGSAIVPARGTTMDAVLPIDLDAGPSTEAVSRWAAQVGPESDLVVITGPPLATSIDAALLACACDGLVIVAESEVTERAALQLAAERARIAGCKALGVVMHGSKDRMPGWVRRLLGDRSESLSS
ncbi:MAG: hypothetical protein IT293_17485 [Deltaproteobacteria bacterium]|nr:hypothetical protein [Deltaproteobacteria bacterium]